MFKLNEKKVNMRKYRGKHAMITKLSQLENGHFVDYFGVTILGCFFTTPGGQWKFSTREEAAQARVEIKKMLAEYL